MLIPWFMAKKKCIGGGGLPRTPNELQCGSQEKFLFERNIYIFLMVFATEAEIECFQFQALFIKFNIFYLFNRNFCGIEKFTSLVTVALHFNKVS